MIERLEAMFEKADAIDVREGLLAYQRYHQLMKEIAASYSFPLHRVVAAFVSLSPNSDYFGNLRSTVSVLDGINKGIPIHRITVSTYRHCLQRAYAYATGEADFLAKTKGPKITNFYHNILDPNDLRWVTVDGHISAVWQGKDLTMREAIIPRRKYNEIAAAVKALAFREFILPCQYQAVVWLTRKRIFKSKFDPQGDLLRFADGDAWKTVYCTPELLPYPLSEEAA